jgi:hypothetical protein
MVETLVHEGSHHATAYTDDEVFQGKKVIKLAGPGKSPEDMDRYGGLMRFPE